jgi:hypothetical protein
MRATKVLGAMAVAAFLVPATARDSRACGGCFHPPTPPNESGTVVTDHQMIFVSSAQQTTLYDMIKYSGAPASFAWVLPIHGTVTVALSSDVVFAALDQLTSPNVIPPPYPTCPVPANCSSCDFAGAAQSGSGGSSGGSTGVTVLTQAVVGPYDTVQVQSTNPSALDTWLSANGYTIPQSVQPIIAAYVNEGFDFLAMRLAPGQGVQAMRPVSVTSAGAGVSLPLRMVAAGTGATVGITLWAVSAGRLEPQNFSAFTIAPSDLVWDWSLDSSNYTSLQQQKEAALGHAAWQTESSLDLSSYTVEALVLGSGGSGSSGGGPAIAASTEGYTGSDAGSGATAEQQRQQDLATLFPGGGGSVRVTRMRADLSSAALANDLVLQASADQSSLSNNYQVTKSINAPPCPNPPVCPCGGVAGSSGSGGFGSSSGLASSSGFASSSGSTGSGSGTGPTTNPASPTKDSFSCAASRTDSGGNGLEFILSGLVGTAVVRARMRRRPRS